MKQQGRCVLPADETGRVLDRLGALEKVISPNDIRQALMDTDRVNPRACKLTHEIMMWVVLAMGIFTNLPIRQVFKHAQRLRAMADTPCRSALCVARKRLGVEPVQRLYERTVHPWPRRQPRGRSIVACVWWPRTAPFWTFLTRWTTIPSSDVRLRASVATAPFPKYGN